jgi:hypothetical protein
MSYSRPSARTLTGVLLGLMLFSIAAAPVVLGNDVPVASSPQGANPSVACGTTVTAPDGTKTFTNGNRPTGWADDVHPPTTVRVLRSQGANKGHVETVPFWWYVGVVMRAEYSTGADKPPLWMQIGAITVKEYGWYKAMHWEGGHVTFTSSVTDPVTLGVTTTSTSECYDLKDTTADQLYRPPQVDSNGVCIPNTGNCPTDSIYKNMAQTWHITLRKWNTTKNQSRMFLTGYRSGSKHPCAEDRTGFKIYQQSLRDCITKGLTLEETLRAYFDPVLIVDTRKQDSLCNLNGNTCDSNWWGDAPSLSDGGGNTAWTFYPGKADGFGAAVTGTFNVPFSSVLGWSTGNVDLPQAHSYAGDPNLLADVVMVTGSNVYVARATGVAQSPTAGHPFADLAATSFNIPSLPNGVSKAVFGDFDGDLMMDVGLIGDNGDGTWSMWVMRSAGNDHFYAPARVWTGADLSAATFVAAGDVNGDGKADLIVRDATGNFNVAASPATCGSMAVYGACTAPGGAALGTLNLALSDPGGLNNATFTVGDIDRDGRDDLVAVNAGTTTAVAAMRALPNASFNGKQSLWNSSANDLTGASALAMNVDPDGMADLAVIKSNGSALWLRTIERSSGPAQMVLSSSFPYTGQDKTAPSAPVNLRATASAGLTVSLVWNPSTDNSGGAVFYRIFRDGNKIGTQQPGLTYTDHPRAGWHAYTVKAVDGVGNLSSPSNKVTVKAVN